MTPCIKRGNCEQSIRYVRLRRITVERVFIEWSEIQLVLAITWRIIVVVSRTITTITRARHAYFRVEFVQLRVTI